MSVKPVQTTNTEQRRYNYNQPKNHQVSFGNNPVIVLMDAIDRGGFATSFIMQDFLGMAGPRVVSGIYRNHDKTGQYNWDFAKKEGIREILSGPSAFIIPAAMMYGIKHVSGSANNVPIDFINGFGESFAKYAKASAGAIGDAARMKEGFYKEMFKNMLAASTDNGLTGKELEGRASYFAKRLIESENAPKKGFIKNVLGKKVPGTAQDIQQELLEDFIKLRKKHLGSSADTVVAQYSVAGDKKIATSFKSIIGHMKDYSEDAIKTVNKKVANAAQDFDLDNFIKTLSKRRTGTRFLSNVGMFGAVAAFYTIIPKLYNRATKGRDPGLDGLVEQPTTSQAQVAEQPKSNKNVSVDKTNNAIKGAAGAVAFTGAAAAVSKAMSGAGDAILNSKGLKKFADKIEFDGASMSMPAMLTLLFGFCLTPRLINAQSNTDRKEIMFRDVLSFGSILFGAKALTRLFSDGFAKLSGLALNIKPDSHKNDNILKKVWHYVYPSGGVEVLDSDRVIANYSDVAKFKDGVNDMFRFVDKNGGNVGKMLNIDENVRKAATEILGEAPNKNMKLKDIIAAFDKAKGTDAYKKVVDTLADNGNKLVKRAKTYNSAFGFASTVLLIPAFMMWISKHCENMTKKRIAEEQAAANKSVVKNIPVPESMQIVTNKPTMAGFLNSKKA